MTQLRFASLCFASLRDATVDTADGGSRQCVEPLWSNRFCGNLEDLGVCPEST